MILPLLLANFGLAAFTNRCRTIHRSPKFLGVHLWGCQHPNCGGQSSELRCVGVPSHIIRCGLKCTLAGL